MLFSYNLTRLHIDILKLLNLYCRSNVSLISGETKTDAAQVKEVGVDSR